MLFLHTQNDPVKTEVKMLFKVTQEKNKETTNLLSNKTYTGLVPKSDEILMEGIRDAGEAQAPAVPGIENSSDLSKLILNLTYFLSAGAFYGYQQDCYY